MVAILALLLAAILVVLWACLVAVSIISLI